MVANRHSVGGRKRVVIGLVALGRAPSSASRFKQISDGKQIVDRCVCFTASSGSQRPPKAAALPRRAQSSLRDLTSCVAQRVVSTWRWQRPPLSVTY
jgi:hypothetical protein